MMRVSAGHQCEDETAAPGDRINPKPDAQARHETAIEQSVAVCYFSSKTAGQPPRLIDSLYKLYILCNTYEDHHKHINT
jgi:hypothetical protein